jgi:hypothetical protein
VRESIKEYKTHCITSITSKIRLFLARKRKMPLRKPTTKHSPRMPKMKELRINEGSTSAAARELEFVSKIESVIQTSTKK